VPELEAWQKVIITGSSGNTFLTSVHGPQYTGDVPHVLTCQHCHAGAADYTFETMEQAHEGMYADPSVPGQAGCSACHAAGEIRNACDGCHTSAVTATANSLHTTQQGYITAIEDRCGCSFEGAGVGDFYDVRCAGCHTTCGQCHISRPNSVGGGFPLIGGTILYSHRFRATPDMTEQCTACHGSRVGADYLGEIEGNAPDAHRSMGMQCTGCHTMDEIHGDGTAYEHRYQVANMPRCEDCHGETAASDVVTVDPGSMMCSTCHGADTVDVPAMWMNHAHHVDAAGTDCSHCHRDGVPAEAPPNAQCQVCHSQPYKNCTNCHNLTDEGYDIEPSVVQLKIARNWSPYRTEYDIALVRHTPVDPGTFDNWNLDLPAYEDKPTWQYTSPHSIQRSTPQTAVAEGDGCMTACHGAADGPEGFLLRETDLYEADGVTPLVDYQANIDIVIPGTFPGGK
jgi:hypothetical protein